jgi:hypothetical protein
MPRARFGQKKSMALVAALAISLSATTSASAAGTVESSRAADPDLTNEVRIMGSYFDDLVALQNECAELEKKAVLLQIQVNPVVRKSDDLTNRLQSVQQTIREVVRKLKVANLWDDLETQVRGKLTSSIVHTEPWARILLQEESFKRLLEAAAEHLSGHKNEISIPVDNLLKRVTSRNRTPYGDRTVALAAYHPLTPVPYRGLACEVGKVMTLAKIMDHLGVVAKSASLNRVSCACGQSTACQ